MTIEFTLEIPIDSVEAAEAAAPHLRPRDRFELCEDLASEGWTPTPELIREVRRQVPSEVEVVAMIRPRLADSRAMLDLEAFLATPECSAGMRVSRTYPPDARRSRGMRLE